MKIYNYYLMLVIMSTSFSVNAGCTDGAFIQVSGSPFDAGSDPVSVAFSPVVSGGLFAAVVNQTATEATGTVSVYSVDQSSGVFTEVTGSPFAVGGNPVSVAFSPLVSGNLFAAVTNRSDNTISVYQVNTAVNTPATGPAGLFTAIGSPIAVGMVPVSIAFSPLVSGNLFAAVANQSSNSVSVYLVDQSSGVFTQVTGSPFTTGNTPLSVAFSAVSSLGNLFAAVVNENDNTVSVYQVNTAVNTPVTGPAGLFTPVTGSPFITGSSPVSVAFSPLVADGLIAAVVNTGSSNLYAYSVDESTGAFSNYSTVFIGGFLNSVAFSPVASGYLFAAIVRSGDMSIGVYSVDQTTGIFTQVMSSPFATGNVPFSVVYSPLASGNLFAANANDGDGTVSVYKVTIGVSLPSATITTLPQTICSGNSVTLNATISGGVAPYTVTWSDGTVQTNQTSSVSYSPTPSVTTTYSITLITDMNGCASTAQSNSVEITVSSPSVALTPATQKVCIGNNATIRGMVTSGTGPYNVTWSDGFTQTSVSSPFFRNVSPIQTTTYSVTSVTDLSDECTSGPSNSVVVNVDSPVTTLSPETQTICAGGSAMIDGMISGIIGGTAPYNVTWSDGFMQTTMSPFFRRSVSPISTTTYTVASVTDGIACTGGASNSVEVTVNPIPTVVVTSSASTVAPGGSITLTSTPTGTAPFTLTWSDGFVQTNVTGITTRVVHPTSTTTYSVIISDTAGCKSDPSAPVTITVQSSLAESALSIAVALKYCLT